MQTPTRLLIQHLDMLFQVRNQRRSVRLAFMRFTQAVQFQAHVLQPQFAPQRVGQKNQLRIDLRTRKAERFSANLVKLAIPPALRTLMAEHGPHVVEALASVIQHGMLSNCANHPCSRFGTQSEMLAIETILERVHLFFDDVRDLTEATNKQRRGLNNRRTDVAIGISSHKGADLGLQPLPSGGFRRQDIVHAFHGHQLFRLGRRSAFFVTHNCSFLYLATIRRTSPTISR